MLLDAYVTLVTKHPRKVLLGLALLCLFLGRYIPDFKLDASADSLVIEGDADLEFSREINARYGTGDFVFIAYTPMQELFSIDALQTLRELRNELQAIDGIASINSILDVPLLKVANATLTNVAENVVTLDTPGVALDAARADLTSNGAYLDVLLNADGSTTALVVNFAPDTVLDDLLASRTELRNRQDSGALAAEEQTQLEVIERDYDARRDLAADTLHTRDGRRAHDCRRPDHVCPQRSAELRCLDTAVHHSCAGLPVQASALCGYSAGVWPDGNALHGRAAGLAQVACHCDLVELHFTAADYHCLAHHPAHRAV